MLTLSAPGVELLHGVVQADPDRGEAHLPLESRHQSVVKTPGPLGAHHGGDGTHHSSILHCALAFHPLGLSLDLAGSDRHRRYRPGPEQSAAAINTPHVSPAV